MPLAALRRMPEPLSKPQTFAPSIADVQAAVCEEFDIDRRTMMSARRDPQICRARMIAMFLANEITDKSDSVIGRAFNRDRSTVYHARHIYGKATGQTADTIARLKAQLMP
jgi:chromosomal replication initiator protein